MKKSDPLNRLAGILDTIQNTALELHESSEKSGVIPLFDLERSILPDSRRFGNDVRCSLLWFLLLFTQPRLVSQKAFQTSLSANLPSAESSLIVRQMMCRPPKAWSYRKSYKRGFAHTIAGPDAHNEISIDGCINANGVVDDADHLYAFGWTLSFEEHIYLIYACQLTQAQTYIIEKTKPFPLAQNDDDFWEEAFFSMVCSLYESIPSFMSMPKTRPETTSYSPERRFEKLNRMIVSTLGSNVIRASNALQITVATESQDAILASVDCLISSNLGSHKDSELAQYLKHRVLEAVGCDDDGNMPHAHPALLTADPVALLLLPSELPLFEHIGVREAIRLALAYDEKNGTSDATKAFEIYQRERRWLAAFPCFDFTIEEHALKFGIPLDAMQAVFDPRLFSAHIPIAPQGEILRQLQNKFGFYLPDAEPPAFIDVLNALGARSFMRTGNMSACVQWIMNCCDRWRYCLCEIEPENAKRTVNQTNQKLLHKGLLGLSAMFKKDNNKKDK